jgi:Ca-activated chloride channel family protein
MSHPFRTPHAAAVLAGLFVLSASAQFSYKTGIDVASFNVTVLNRAGEPVAGLKAEDFEAREDGVPQTISYFSAGTGDDTVPLHIGLMFDTSESMEKDLAFARNAAIRFLNTFPKAADFTLVEFADDVRRQVRPGRVSADGRAHSQQQGQRAHGPTTRSAYMGSAFDLTGRKALVLYTDGGDTSSSRTWNEAMRLLRTADVTVYPIGFSPAAVPHAPYSRAS